VPTTPTYPGVYIEEIRSGVRTITGVSTSVTAFVGYTRNGPINKAEEILSFADFERKFGGLAKDSLLSYAVQHFFMNGGQQAYVVRLAQEGTATEASVTLNSLVAGAAQPVLQITAREPGARANGVAIRVNYATAHPDSTFNLRVEDAGTGRTEEFLGVTMSSKSRRNVDNVVNGTSQLIRVETSEDTLADVESERGESRSGGPVDFRAVDSAHRQFMITLDEEDGPKLVTIYDGSAGNEPASLAQLATSITNAVKAIDPAGAYQDFEVDVANGGLVLRSGEEGDGSFVRVTSAGTLDAARVLKLGVANGGRETDAAAGIRPAPIGTTSGSLEELPPFASDRRLLVTVDGDGPHEVSVFRDGTDTPPANLSELRSLLQERLRQVKPDTAGSTAFMGIDAEVVGDRIQVLSGAEDNDSLVRFENLRVLESLNSVSFVSATVAWAVGDNGTILRWDGTNWTRQAAVPGAEIANLRGVFFRSNALGWAVGTNGTVLRFANNAWTKVTLPANALAANLRSVHFKSDDIGLAVGEGGIILKTTTGSTTNTWTKMTSAPGAESANLRGVFLPSAQSDRAWAVGDAGTILSSNDAGGTGAGGTWTKQAAVQGAENTNLHGVHFVGVNDGWAVGDGGAILRWNGTNWVKQAAVQGAENTNLHGVNFLVSNNGWAVGDRGTILHFTNAWALSDSDVTFQLNGVHFQDATHGLAVGAEGAILRSDGADWSVQQAVIDESAEDLELTASEGSHNVKAYTMGVGKALGAQSGATPGQDGLPPRVADFQGSEDKKSGIYALLDVDIFNILCLPDVTGSDFELNDAIAVLSTAVPFCERLRAFCIIDCPNSWTTFDDALRHLPDFNSVRSKNAAMYFPRVEMPDPLDDNRLRTFPPSGILAGIYARMDATRGVWKAPAGQEAALTGVRSLVYRLTDRENGLLNPLGLNCLRVFPIVGSVSWGARTLHGADVLASEWKYVPVRRLALYLEESLYRGTQWVVFEPNDEPLWAQIRLNLGAFMHNLFRQGAFQGTSPRDAYFVKCDKETTTQNDIDRGIVNILVGFAPLKPAEFVIVKIQQMAGQIQT
jgi:phage tail sheath protein FI/photosystem II stability/assembly factor-like uncharacterized protein